MNTLTTDQVAAGSTFVNNVATAILSPKVYKETTLAELCDDIIKLVKKEGSVDLPRIMEVFHVSADEGLRALEHLRLSGKLKQN